MVRPEAVLMGLRLDPRLDAESMLRAVYLCFLVDWKSTLESGHQIIGLEWKKASFGPFSPDIISAIQRLKRIKDAGHATSDADILTNIEASIVEDVRLKYSSLPVPEIGKLVMSTFPMLFNNSKETLDLSHLARTYKEDFKLNKHKISA